MCLIMIRQFAESIILYGPFILILILNIVGYHTETLRKSAVNHVKVVGYIILSICIYVPVLVLFALFIYLVYIGNEFEYGIVLVFVICAGFDLVFTELFRPESSSKLELIHTESIDPNERAFIPDNMITIFIMTTMGSKCIKEGFAVNINSIKGTERIFAIRYICLVLCII